MPLRMLNRSIKKRWISLIEMLKSNKGMSLFRLVEISVMFYIGPGAIYTGISNTAGHRDANVSTI